jgi:hypothetical protein
MKKTLAVFGIAGLLAATLSGCAAGPTSTTLEKVSKECNLSAGVRIGDEGKTLSIDMMGEDEYDGATIDDIICVVNSPLLEMPQFVINSIETTRALDGKQDGDWAGFEAQWSYHPDNGLDLMIHQK